MADEHHSGLTHVDDDGRPRMVDVGGKAVTAREARARAEVVLPDAVLAIVADGELATKKGPVFATAIIAGVMAAKRTHELIPFCHPLGLTRCDVSVALAGNVVAIDSTCAVNSRTGVEMEALTAVTVAALTVYDMCKALSHDIVIRDTRLIAKSGGKSDFQHDG